MGLDNDAVTFLVGAKSAGANFDRTVTIGRQNFYPSVSHLQRAMATFSPTVRKVETLTTRGGYAEPFFELLGANEVASIDASSYEGATLVHDLNDPIPDDWKGRFTAVVDGGSLEHVFDFPRALRNATELLSVGGHYISITPANNYMGHGFYQFSPELFFRVFVPENGFRLRTVLIRSYGWGSRWHRVLDPAVVQGRVELQNGLQTLLYILAQKIDETAIHSFRPQQSDYSAIWREEGGAVAAKAKLNALQRLPAFFKRPLKRLLPLFTNAPFAVKSSCYKRIEEPDVLSGKF